MNVLVTDLQPVTLEPSENKGSIYQGRKFEIIENGGGCSCKLISILLKINRKIGALSINGTSY